MVAIEKFVADRLPVVAMMASGSRDDGLGAWFAKHWAQPPKAMLILPQDVIIAFLAFVITYCLVCIIILGLGFGPSGVAAGSCAAAFQSVMYGAFTPAGGVFATLTSMAMLGWLMPAALFMALVFATGVAAVVWVCGVGR
ncbi:hypothetical protein MMYC01_201578 [Madurella mycetomatis]|uniref:Uncharacterized protein n=1 Tax=Madurella mycetomatis TaxID=100816 RepID=A0A175WC14_9PEZI|nr:hypothetical protein MMYC01_201578 [Madurella mycetomatis]